VARRSGTAGPATVAYGPHPDQVGDRWDPTGAPPADGWPVAVLVHGGFWRERYRRDLMDPMAADLVARGWAVWNLEYRRVRGAGGWPMTLEDLAAGVDHLAAIATSSRWDLTRSTVIGHSAGGHLALWAAGRQRLPSGAPGARPRVVPARVVALAPVADLPAADAAGLSDGAVRELLGGGPDEHPDRWRVTDPVGLVGHGVPVLLVHGDRDVDVPLAQSESYRQAARQAADPVELVTGPWDHLELIDPASPGWHAVRRSLRRGTKGPGTPVRARPPHPGTR
jgi:acetyl esterase/lipase